MWLFILLLFVLNSCINIFEEKEYVSIYIVNNTSEYLEVYAGMTIIFDVPSAIIPDGNGQSVLAVKGYNVRVFGKDSRKNYGSRTFYYEAQWDLY
jgi:hypothetical protein